jgi:putative membrane protein
MSYSLYRFVLSLHIVFIICWMAGILYLYRLFVYHAEETETVVKERFKIMEKRLLRYITMPAMLASLVFGVVMLGMNPSLLHQPWMHAKLFFVVLLMGMTHYSGIQRKQLESGTSSKSGRFYRILNEIPTLLMLLIVLLVIMRPF